MVTTLPNSRVSAADRLGLTLFLATIFHGIIILGISFSQNYLDNDIQSRPLDVILVHTWSDEAPKDAERIAQHNQQKSGSQDTPDTPSQQLSSMMPSPTPGIAPRPQRQMRQQVELMQSQQFVHTTQAKRQIESQDKTQRQKQTTHPQQKEMTQREMEIARLAAEIEQGQQHYAERPKIHFIDALSAKSAVEAQYIDDWVNKVEGIGNLNYPAQAKRERISGKLILNVLLDNDGSVLKVQIAISSGSRVLDQAAVEIVKMSSPFPPFPREMRAKYDQLMITRTWKFNTQGL
ncbi:MAG TPA: energy transducer TonB [Gammaproteobacteria bacterium]|nr:energy transducer TonB [Gammaproteobacteria bacterium]